MKIKNYTGHGTWFLKFSTVFVNPKQLGHVTLFSQNYRVQNWKRYLG